MFISLPFCFKIIVITSRSIPANIDCNILIASSYVMVDMFPLLCFLARTRNLQIAFLSKFQSLAHGVNEVLKYACQVVCTSFRELNFLTNFLQRKAGFRILLFFLSCLRTKNLLKILGCVAGHLRTICLLDDLFCLNPSDNASDGKVFSVPMHY